MKFFVSGTPGRRLNKKTLSYQKRDPHDKDKTVSQLSYLYYENPHTWEDCLSLSLYWDEALVVSVIYSSISFRITSLEELPYDCEWRDPGGYG